MQSDRKGEKTDREVPVRRLIRPGPWQWGNPRTRKVRSRNCNLELRMEEVKSSEMNASEIGMRKGESYDGSKRGGLFLPAIWWFLDLQQRERQK